MIVEATQTSPPAVTNTFAAGRAASLPIRKVGVLGAGTMGSRIAAHLANAGVPVVLLDIVPKQAAATKEARNAISAQAIETLKKAKPDAFYDPSVAGFITLGNFEDDLPLLACCDWIIEAVTENLEIKRALLQRVEGVRRADAIVTTNTSGLPVGQICEGFPESFRRNWFGTHFFNPPRYMRLLEVIPGPATDPAAVATIEQFADKRLGKTIVRSEDTPNFIANRIGTFALLNTIRIMQAMDLTIEQVDALTGTALGWPRTGTFRLSDLVGIDVLANVAKNFEERVRDERPDVRLPDLVKQLLERKWLGDKTGQGFYKKQRGNDGEELRLALAWKTLEYRPAEKARIPALDVAKNVETTAERVRMLLAGDQRKDVAAAFYWQFLPELWNYAAHRIGEVSDDVAAIDDAMKAGFNWELGPFELWDAAGIRETIARMKEKGMPIAPAAEQLLAAGLTSWYTDDKSLPSGRRVFDPSRRECVPVQLAEGVTSVQILKRAHGVISKNPGASLIDLGDGVACIEFHTKMNAIGGDIVSFVTQTLKPESRAVRDFDAFVISSDAANFSAGANLVQLLLAIQEDEWDDVNLFIKQFQNMTQAIKFSPRPVVAGPFGLCLGGGTEVCLHAASRQAHAELYIGLVEAGVGLLPAGGGCKEMLLHALDRAASVHDSARSDSVEAVNALRGAFEAIAMAKVSTSAVQARSLGLLQAADGITINRGRLLTDAKAKARAFADAGFVPPVPRTDIPAPGESVLASMKIAAYTMREGAYISDHDVKIARKIAHVLSGGNVTPGTPVSEQYLLDLEREAFLSLCGEKKTQERIAHTLKTGKPLRN